ncbi:Acyl-CoA carboxylase epsilon subunit [Geodermatophilus obscurus]|uniref:Acyl-CoA carboxylase epsilon subunit n=1 Tax=Geodermatophilus obscurus TaxID=1861 RepID=A0A1I5FCG9_9ACTN|nr:acyl-CoA carboxylase subunit epsilon [Geodermatophilus obscurus]SFO21437.1 Acyl-CoA carboxylase epsilon subunit [Geodermatophilus obscurus]
MTSRPSGPHRGHEPSPTRAEPTPALVAEASGPHSSDRALLRVVRGEPSAEELAALTVVVAALSRQGRPRQRPVPVGAWASPGDAHRPGLRPGPGGWRAAGRFG